MPLALLVLLAVIGPAVGLIAPAPASADPLPAVTAVSPKNGPRTGGTTVVITGSGFTGATRVAFGGWGDAPTFTVDHDGQITAVSPATGNTGLVNVLVTTAAGTSAKVAGDYFTFGNPTSIDAVDPPAASAAGGTAVQIQGNALSYVTSLTVDGVSIPFTYSHATGNLVATMPAHATGNATIAVDGSWGAASRSYLYVAPGTPLVTRVQPYEGPVVGDTVVDLYGYDLDQATGVRFGTTPATTWTIVDAQHLRVTTPAVATTGTVVVTVTSAAGDSPDLGSGNTFRYVAQPPPGISSLTPNFGPVAGGNTVVIRGTGFLGTTRVRFGLYNDATSFTVDSNTQITAVAPPAPTASTFLANVFVTTPLGTNPVPSWSSQYSYTGRPTVTSLSPASGPTAGGTTVTITGTNLASATAVAFGSVPATSFHVVNGTTITAVAPPQSSRLLDVTVTTPNGTSTPTAGSAFRYVDAPYVSSVSPTRGPIIGGTTVVIRGSNFTGTTSVAFGSGLPAASFTVDSDTQITAVSPARSSAAVVNIFVTNSAGTNVNAARSWFTYQA